MFASLFTSMYFIYMYAVIQSLHALDIYTSLVGCLLSPAISPYSAIVSQDVPISYATSSSQVFFSLVSMLGMGERKLSTSIVLLHHKLFKIFCFAK